MIANLGFSINIKHCFRSAIVRINEFPNVVAPPLNKGLRSELLQRITFALDLEIIDTVSGKITDEQYAMSLFVALSTGATLVTDVSSGSFLPYIEYLISRVERIDSMLKYLKSITVLFEEKLSEE
jgi:hypothetical protein